MFEGLFRPEHLLLILIICLLLFGPRRLPELGKGLGEAIKGFKDGIRHSDAPSTTAASTPAPVSENKTEVVQK